jgi:hypothetical protein
MPSPSHRFHRIRVAPCFLALTVATIVAVLAAPTAHAAASPRRSPARSQPANKQTLAQRIHDARVRQKAWSKKHADEMASSREYARRGDETQADAFLLNAQDSKRKAEMYRRQAEALRRQVGRSSRRRGRR